MISFAEWKNSKKKEQNTGNSISFAEWSNKKTASKVDQAYLDSFFAEADAFLKASTERYNTLGWSNASSLYDTTSKEWSDLQKRANKISTWAEYYKDQLGEEYYKNTMDSLSAIISSGNSIHSDFHQNRNFYSQFDTEDAYNEWYEQDQIRQGFENVRDTDAMFDHYVQSGTGVANPTWEKAHAPIQIGGWTPFGDGEEIGNFVTFAEENRSKAFASSAQAIRGGGGSGEHTQLALLIDQYMKDEEKAVYNYYIGKGDKAKADEYLTYIADILRQREAGVIAEKIDNTGMEAVFSGLAGVEQWMSGVKNLDNLIKGTEGDPTSTMQYAQSSMSSNNEGIWKVTNDFINSAGNMLPSIVVGTATGGLGGALATGLSSAGNSYSEMIKEGYGADQARKYGIMVGTAEGGLSYLFSGISKVGGKVTGKAISKAVDGIDNGIARFFVDYAINTSSEALEEGAQAILDPVFKKIATGEDFEGIDWSEVGYSAMLGGLSAGLLEGVPNAANSIHTNYQTNIANGGLSNMGAIKAFKDNGIKGVADAYNAGKAKVTENAGYLVNEALEIDPDNAHAQRMQTRLDAGKNVSGYQIDRLVEANESAMYANDSAKIKDAVVNRLLELGEVWDVNSVADAITKQAMGAELTAAEKRAIQNSSYGYRVATEVDPSNVGSGNLANKWAESIGTEKYNVDEYNRGIPTEAEAATPQAKTLSVTENTPVKENATEGKISTSTEGIKAATESAEFNDINFRRAIQSAGINTSVTDALGPTIQKYLSGEITSRAELADVIRSEFGDKIGTYKLTEDNLFSLVNIIDTEASKTAKGVSAKLSTGATVSKDNVSYKTESEKLVADIATERISNIKGFTAEAASAMISGYDGNINPSEYTTAFDNAFKMGASGVPSSKLTGVINSGVSERVAYTAYELGRQSAEKVESDLKSLSENGIINTNESEAKNENGENVHLRNGSKRDGGKNTQRQVSRMEDGTGQAESRGKTARIADSEAARLVNEGREVKVSDLGILGGSKEQTVRLVDKANETSSMKEARKRAEARGLKVTFFTGDNLVIKDKSGEWISARAYIMGKHVVVRADHPLYTADQLMRHELGHDMIAKGEVDIKAVRERLEETVGKENIDAVAESYVGAYAGTGMTAEEIWEECICDSLGDMNIFAGKEKIGSFFDLMLPKIGAVASESKAPTQTRGSPEGKTSRETDDLYTATDEFYRDVPYGIREDFARSLANKTAEMVDGETKTIYVCGYIFKAEGYMQGHMLAPYTERTKKLLEVKKNRYDEINQDGEIAPVWTEAVRNAERGSGSDSGVSRRGRSSTDDTLLGKSSERDSSRDNERVWTNPRTEEEYHEIVNKVRIMYGLEPVDYSKGKASRELDSLGNELSPAVAKRFANSKVVDEDGRLKVVYHGTVSGEFNIFDKSKGSVEGDFGSGFYFTDKETDVEQNYEFGGPDFENKVWRRAEQIWDEDSDIQMEEARTKAREELYKESHRFEVYLNIENPAVVGETILFDNANYLEMYDEADYDSYDDYIGDVEQALADEVDEIIWDIERNIDLYSSTDSIRNALYDAYYEGGVDVETLKTKINELYLESTDGEMVGNEVTRQIIESLGYDGIIDSTVSSKFKNMGMEEGTTHYIAFKPNQIKSITNQNPTDNPDIRYSRELDFIDFINEQAGEESDPNLTKAQNVAKVRGELEKINVGKGEIMAVTKVADKMFDLYGGDNSISDFRYGLLEATKLALDGSENGFEAAYEIIHTLAKEVAYNPKDVGGEAALLSEIKREMRGTKLSVHEADKTSGEFDIYGGYGEFRKKLFGKINLANDGIGVDTKYMELQNLYGKGFFPDVNTVSEQLMQIEKLMNTPLSEYMVVSDTELEAAADEMVTSLFDKLGSIWSKAVKSLKPVAAVSDEFSNRSLLAGVLEVAAQNDIERNKLKQYKEKIDLINGEEQKLLELRIKIKELSKKGPRDTEAIKNLQFEANQAANRINTYDRQLLNLESTKALKGVLEREKAQARKRAEQQGKEALARARERSAKTQRELMTRYQESRKKATEGRNKTAMRHKIRSVVKDLNKLLNRGTKERNVKEELRETVASSLALAEVIFSNDITNEDIVRLGVDSVTEKESKLLNEYSDLLDTIDALADKREYFYGTEKVREELLAKVGSVEEQIAKVRNRLAYLNGQLADVFERERARLNKATAKQLMANLASEYQKLKDSNEDYIRAAYDEYIYTRLDALKNSIGGTIARDMSLAQLTEVYDAYKMVEHFVRNANEAFKAQKGETISVIANNVLEELDKLPEKLKFTKMGKVLSKFDWNNLKPIYALERIGSAAFTRLYNNVRAGEDVWAVDMTDAQAFLEEQKKKYKYDTFDFDKKYKFTSSTGKDFELTLGQIMSLYAFSKRGGQAKEHLEFGGFVFDGATEVKEKKAGIEITYELNNPTAYKLNDAILGEITKVITDNPNVKGFADAMQDYLSTVMGEKGNEVSLELYGIKMFKEEDYFPLKTSQQYLERAREQATQTGKIKNKGFTKQTQPHARTQIVLSSFMDVWAEHVNEMSMYHAFTLALEDFYRVYNYSTPNANNLDTDGVIPFIEKAHGQAATAYVDQLLKDLNGGAKSDPRETLAKSLMSKFKKASVIASASVVIQQPSSIVRAQALVDAKYFVGKRVSEGKHKETWAEVKKYAPVAIIKEMGYFDVGMGQSSVEWLKGEKTWKDKMDDALSKAPALADEYTWTAIWNAVKRETAHNNPTLKTSSEDFLKLAGERFTEVITKTQVYDSTLARSANMRSKSGLMNMWTSFMAEPTTSINMLQDAFKKGNKKQIARTMGAVYGSVVLNAALVSLVYAMRDDDEDETFLEKYMSRFVTEVIDGINPLTYIPFVKDIWSALQGYDIERTDMTLITSVFDSLEALAKVAFKDTSDMDEDELSAHRQSVAGAVFGLADTLASLTGLPVKNIRREINGIINGVKTIVADANGRKTTAGSLGDNILEDVKDSTPVWGWFPDESKGDKLYDAIIKGDDDYVERLESGYKSESAISSAIRKALRENDPRIKEAAEALSEGDFDEYSDILNEIVEEDNFDFKDIKAAILKEYEDMTPDEESSSTESKGEKQESAYETEWLYIAASMGDTEMAEAMREEIINIHIANGKSREDAETSLNNSFTSSVKKYYEEGDISDYEAKSMLVNFGGKTKEEAESKVQYWNFKKQYPDYDLSESAVSKYYSDVKPSGISVQVYYDYSQKRSKAQGVDLNGDGKADSGTVKREVMQIINSLPISSYQKDALYYLNGWSQSTLWEAPWH